MKFTELRTNKLASTQLGEITEGIAYNFYDLKEEHLGEKEREFASFLESLIQRRTTFSELEKFDGLPENFRQIFQEEIISVIEINRLLERMPSRGVFVKLLESLIRLISKVDFISNKGLFAETVLHDSIGLKKLAFFSMEDELEELMVNSLEEIFVFHKEYGMCKTNIVLDEKGFSNIIQRVAASTGKGFNQQSPLLDSRLPDGSRINATMDNVSPRAISLTIRKFSPVPITILDLIKKDVITSEAASFLWMMTDGFGVNPKNILVTGSTASGKTTMLNVLTNFVRLNERIITIEDTLELSLLDRENWVALEAKHYKEEEITMNNLLKNSLRMRPDRIIVGEVRGNEAITLFTAMDNGHSGTMGTIHANNARETITKLQERPFSVPTALLPLVELIVVLKRTFSKEKGIERKVIQITEVSRMENKVLLANVFELNNQMSLVRTDVPSYIVEKFAEQNSITKNELKEEMRIRQLVLEWMLQNNVSKPREVLEIIQSYYFDSKKVLSMIEQGQ